MAYPDHTPWDPDPKFGSQGLILLDTNSLEFGDNKRIKHNGVKKAGALTLIPGVTYGISQVSG
jgi:hypothetical protein